MKSWTVFSPLAAATLLAVSLTLTSAAERKHRHHGAHEHGHGSLNLAVEGDRLQLELELPGADAVGFEHAARTKAQKAAVRKAISALKAPERMVEFSRQAKCRAVKDKTTAKVQVPEGKDDDHREFVASYVFRCDTMAKLTRMDMLLFKRFRSLKEVKVQAVSSRGQIRKDVKRRSPGISLKLLFK